MSNQAGPFNRSGPKPTVPLKGSFPLDHDAECKREMFAYMKCINMNKGINQECRQFAKAYLGCRMDKGLMERDDWEHLGFKEDDDDKTVQK
jgi:cytochrome c oxidase assembly protein subunit 19